MEMNEAQLESEARAIYRVFETKVQRLHKGQWKTVYYSATPESAVICLEKCIKRYVEFAKMTLNQRMLSILR